jgi:hypothetical protein
MFEEEPGGVTLVAVEVPRSGRKQARSQQLWCHARCLSARLHEGADFDADSFEGADSATVENEDLQDEAARARAADDGWPSPEDERYGRR